MCARFGAQVICGSTSTLRKSVSCPVSAANGNTPRVTDSLTAGPGGSTMVVCSVGASVKFSWKRLWFE